MRGSPSVATAHLLDAWLAPEMIRVAIGVNTWEGVEYIDRDRLRELLAWAVRLDVIDGVATARRTSSAAVAARLAESAESAAYRIDRLRTTLAPPTAAPRSPRATPTRTRTRRSAGRATGARLPEKDPPQE
jgi:hypothetical protein